MKKVIIAVGAAVLAVYLILAIFNLVVGIPVPDGYAGIAASTAEMEVAKEVIGAKCLMCHAQDPALPFYAKLPGAAQLIRGHVTEGSAFIDLRELMEAAGESEVLLAKLEQTVELDTMPILPFMLMHWSGRLSAEEKEQVLTWIRQVRADKYSTGLAAAEFASDPVQPIAVAWPFPLDADKVQLGNVLYHDNRLSGDDTISCASCHDLAKGGTDQAQFSTGVRGQLGGINAPTTFNAAFNVLQFWDGRARHLADQAGGPPLNPVEMDTNWEQVIGKLSRDAELTALYEKVYGTKQWDDESITDAIAEFEKTLLTPGSALDRYLEGDDAALTESEKQGYALFKEHSCATCHTGRGMGGQSFERAVDPEAYYEFRGIDPADPEYGRYNVTGNEEDRYKLKVPLLRNIALTHPYLHDGQISDLTEVVKIMNDHFVPEQNRRELTDDRAEKIVEMLKKNSGMLGETQL
jgi:cytochrome c peroxidase